MAQFVYGKNVVKQLLIDQSPIKNLYLIQANQDIALMAKKYHVPFKIVDKKWLNEKTKTTNHQGVLAEILEYPTYSVQEVLEQMDHQDAGLLILLDELVDPHNLGAILRTADAVNATGVIFKKTNSVGLTPTVAKVSAGAIDTVKCCPVTNLSRTIEELKKAGWWIVGTTMNGQDYRQLKYDFKTVLVIGNEGKGISRLVKEHCDYLVTLPMQGKISSLNASVSAGILMYEIFNKRFPL